MKNKFILVGIIIVFIIVMIVMIIFNHTSSTFILNNKEEGSIIITAKNASGNSGGVGEIALQEGQKYVEMKIRINKHTYNKM